MAAAHTFAVAQPPGATVVQPIGYISASFGTRNLYRFAYHTIPVIVVGGAVYMLEVAGYDGRDVASALWELNASEVERWVRFAGGAMETLFFQPFVVGGMGRVADYAAAVAQVANSEALVDTVLTWVSEHHGEQASAEYVRWLMTYVAPGEDTTVGGLLLASLAIHQGLAGLSDVTRVAVRRALSRNGGRWMRAFRESIAVPLVATFSAAGFPASPSATRFELTTTAVEVSAFPDAVVDGNELSLEATDVCGLSWLYRYLVDGLFVTQGYEI